MRWEKTSLTGCRWSGTVYEALDLKSWDIIWHEGEGDYQGSASFIAKKGAQYLYYGWSWGSCSGCDSWENEEIGAVIEEIKTTVMLLDNKDQLWNWGKGLAKENKIDMSKLVGEELAGDLDQSDYQLTAMRKVWTIMKEVQTL